MSVIKSFFIAFSIYSKIPMPQFEWKKEDMRYALCFFPWVGAVIGVCIYAWYWLADKFAISNTALACFAAALPLIISGGFHADGFLDTSDALHSYQSKERKIEILSDSHVGAFAIISFVIYELIFVGAAAMITTKEQIIAFSGCFFLSRCLSGIGVISFKCAKSKGLLYEFSDTAQKRVVSIALYVQLIASIAFLIYMAGAAGIIVSAAVVITFFYYRYKSYKEFGGTTGDLAGWFVTLSEGVAVLAVAIYGLFI